MFFKNLFRKDPATLIAKGEKLLAAGRYADARLELMDALARLESDAIEAPETLAGVRSMIAQAGNRLAEMNLEEAKAAVRAGELTKAEDYVNLALTLSDDLSLQEQARTMLSSFVATMPPQSAKASGSHCGGCHTGSGQTATSPEDSDALLSEDDQFELLVRPLPGSLPERYLGLGKEFAYGYVAAHSGDIATARATFQRLLQGGDNDIVLYELALLHHHEGNMAQCEALLRRALAVNGDNPLCNLSIVQLLTGSGRFDEAVPLLTHMVERNILPDEATMFLAEISRVKGEDEQAIDCYTRLLNGPLKRDAAGRLVQLLEKQGRNDEAAYVTKTYLKGCC